MPQNTDCLGSKLARLLGLDFGGKGGVQTPLISERGVASLGNDPNPNILEGFIPPGEFGRG
jgi:hypothetical protein